MAVTINGTTGLATDSTSAVVEAVSLNHPSSSTTAITMDASDNVGIGTASPDAKLKVVATGANLLVGYAGTQNYFDASENIFRNFSGTTLARIDSDGLKFNSDTAAANALDDYEEGHWSPFWCDSNGNAIFDASATVNFAHYTKVGRYVTASCYFNMPGSFGTTSYYSAGGALRLGGLPFTAYATGSNNYYAGSVGWYSSWSWDAGGVSVSPLIYTRHNTTVLNMVYPTTNGVGTILMQNVNVGGSGMIITATYFTQA